MRRNGASYPSTQLNITTVPVMLTLTGNKHGEVVSFTSIRFHDQYTLDVSDVMPQVLRCRLTWCVKTYSASRVDDGVFRDEPTSINPLAIDTKSCYYSDDAQTCNAFE